MTARRKTIRIPRVVVAGLRGGAGKTTLSIGLAAALREKGLRTVPFKKGPDYIDAGWLASAAGSPCYNLDPFLVGEDTVLPSFVEHGRGADCAVIEGNRGIFDGLDAEGSLSTARLARDLKSPVILVMDCTKVTRTAAALLKGVASFERGLKLAGVVLNRLAGKRHEAVIRESIERYTGIEVLGAIPRLRDIELPERHMGLTPWQEHASMEDSIRFAAEVVRQNVALDRVLQIAESAPPLASAALPERAAVVEGPSIGIVRDSAFQFYYPENVEELRKRGAKTTVFSALDEKRLPAVDALYIGGGFPETHAMSLAKNTSFLAGLRRAVEDGLPVYAECGGLMYLGKKLLLDGRAYKMAGVFPISFSLHGRPQAHGYTIVKVTKRNPFYKVGAVLRGHEFHYSRAEGVGGSLNMAFKMQRGEGIAEGRDGLCYKNVLATYTHLHALGSPDWADGMLRAAIAYRKAAAR